MDPRETELEERERRVAERGDLRRGGERVSRAASSGIGWETERALAGEWGGTVSVTDGGDMAAGGAGGRRGAAETKSGRGRKCVRLQSREATTTALQLRLCLVQLM